MRDTIDDSDGLLKPIPSASRPHAASSMGIDCASGTSARPSATVAIAAGIRRRSPTAAYDAPDQQALHQREHRADEREHVADVRAREAEAPLAEQRERRFETRERRADDEVEHEQQQQPRLRERAAKQLEAPSRWRRRRRHRPRLRQQEPRRHEIREAQGRREPHRRRWTEVRQDAAERRPEDEPQAERRADHPHAARAVLRRRDVGDVGLRGWDVRAGNAADDARQRRSARASRRARGRDTRDTSRAVRSG